jgi:hypothetical protein
VADAGLAGRLTAADLELLLEAAGEAGSASALRADPERVEGLLRSAAVDRALFGSGEVDPVVLASPLVAFAVLVNRVARELGEATFVEEWLGPGRTVPVFDVGSLREFLGRPSHRTFLAELLASYTRVASGTVWQRTPRGWRRRRYSELDPLRLAQLLEVVPEAQRAAVCRRLGDLALFLAGIFPEHVAAHPLEARHVNRIRRLLDATALDAPAPPPDELVRAGGAQRGAWLLEWLGRRAYGLAMRADPRQRGELGSVVEGFGRARRVLNVLASRHLFPARDRWFPR